MGTLVRILLGLLAIAGFCIIMDLITLLYEYAWVIPAIIGVIFIIRFIVRPDFRAKFFALIVGRKTKGGRNAINPVVVLTPKVTKNVEALKEMIDVAASDGEISEAEKRAIARKGVEMGVAPHEVESIINEKTVRNN